MTKSGRGHKIAEVNCCVMSCWSARKVPCKSPVSSIGSSLHDIEDYLHNINGQALQIAAWRGPCLCLRSIGWLMWPLTQEGPPASETGARAKRGWTIEYTCTVWVVMMLSPLCWALMDHGMLPPLLGDNFRNSEYKWRWWRPNSNYQHEMCPL